MRGDVAAEPSAVGRHEQVAAGGERQDGGQGVTLAVLQKAMGIASAARASSTPTSGTAASPAANL